MIIYDIEIAKCIQSRGEERDNIFEYCDGWHDHANMGISCLCLYDYVTTRYRVFMQDNIDEFTDLLLERYDQGAPIVSFNGRNFDNKVLQATWLLDGIIGDDGLYNTINLLEDNMYDILQEVWKAVTQTTEYVDDFDYKIHAGYGLNQCVKAINPAMGKTGLGAHAPVDFQLRRYGSLIDYCLADVWNTKYLLEYILHHDGVIPNPKSPNQTLRLRVDPKLKDFYHEGVLPW